ncbi:MAG: glycoside hydrolase family 2 protein [Rikenellaceae bacterium]
MRQTILLSLTTLLFACSGNGAKELLNQPSDFSEQTISKDWNFRQVGQSEWLPATVPGVVHTDLLDNKKIEEPFGGTAEPRLQWIEHETWEYQTTFTPTAEVLAAEVKELVFEGLDTYSDVYLNDSLVLSSDNMFREWRLDVASLLKGGENSLRVVFHPAYDVAEPMAEAWPVKLPADNDKGDPWQTSVFTRKAPYSFGWDWGPRFATVGIWKPVMIQAYNTARIEHTQYIQKSQSSEVATFDAHLSLSASKADTLMVTIVDDKGAVYGSTQVAVAKGSDNKLTIPFEIKNPKLWWPNGAGEPNLYALSAVVSSLDEKVKYDQKDENIGVRTIRVVQEPDSVGEGVSFYFEVNGVPIFAKGANYIPHDNFLPRVTDERYKDVIDVTRESNMNMLRVWGGGIYESDEFYDLCDKNGIMVWQDFIFGCSLYPWNEEFFESIRLEAKDNIRRLRNHPSLAIWCGNNEITELWYHWGYQDVYKWTQDEQDMIYKGMRDLFYGLLPEVLSSEDTTRYYHPSSPTYGRGNPQSQIEGDVHYWGVFHDEEPFSVYKDKPGRFSNEYGFQSLACYDTYREYFAPEDIELYSEAMVIHQKNPKGYRVIEEYMIRDLPLLKDDFRRYVYLTQLLQAEGIKIAMEGHRGKRPWTMGSLYWQLNDCWPVASWSSIDSEMRWKALQFYARRSFAPTLLSFEAIDSSSMTKLRVLNDRQEAVDFKGSLKLMDFSGKVLYTKDLVATAPNNQNIELLYQTQEELLTLADGTKMDPTQVILVAEGVGAGESMRSIFYFVPFKDLDLPNPEYTVDYLEKDGKIVAKITADNLLKSVLFEAQALQNNPSDGYFDMLPGETREIILDFKEQKSIDDLGIFVTTLNTMVGLPSEKPITENVK